MESLISLGDVDGLRRLYGERKEAGEDDEVLNALVDKRLRERAILIGGNGGNELIDRARILFNTAIQMSISGMASKTTPIAVMTDLFDISCIGVCKELFPLLEEKMDQLKLKTFDGVNNNSVLRVCNDVLRRLSRCVETSFSGRINLFLSRFMPLNEKSALNSAGHFNTANITKFDTLEIDPCTSLVPADEDDGIDKKNKEAVPIDYALYTKFWQIQMFMSNPSICFDKAQWKLLQRDTNEVFALLASHKLEKSGGYEEDEKEGIKKKDNDNIVENEYYFAKYLTNPKLLHLQFNDVSFRRTFLLQCLILFQYLTADVKMKSKVQLLSEEDRQWVKDKADKAHQLLKDVPPRGSDFARSIQAILARESKWNEWKNKGCPNLLSDAKDEPIKQFKKRARTGYDPDAIDLGNNDLTKLWQDGSDILESCKSKKRKFAPELISFLQDPLLEMDPEQQIDEQYKRIGDNAFQWKTGRLLLSANSLLLGANMNTVTHDMREFLESSMLTTAKSIPELKEEVEKAEEGKKVKGKGNKKESNGDSMNGDMKKDKKDEETSQEDENEETSKGNNGKLYDKIIYLIAEELLDEADAVMLSLSLSKEKAIDMADSDKDKLEILEALLLDWSNMNDSNGYKMRDLLSSSKIDCQILQEFCK